MNNRHLIALDLDGTLLTDQKTISAASKNILNEAINQGHIVVIATGRPHRASIDYYNELNLKTPMINFNGALVHHPHNKNWVISHTPLPKETALDIIQTCYDFNVRNILAEVEDNVFLDQYDEAILDIFRSTLPKSMQNTEPFYIGSLKQKLQNDPTSLLIHPEEHHIQQLRHHLNDHHAELIEHRKWGAPWNIIEIVKKGINKAVGLKSVADYFNISQNRIIAFGDEDNDLEMIDYAGVGVAMGNAIDPLKSLAKATTLTNQEDGIALFLKEYLNIKIKVI